MSSKPNSQFLLAHSYSISLSIINCESQESAAHRTLILQEQQRPTGASVVLNVSMCDAVLVEMHPKLRNLTFGFTRQCLFAASNPPRGQEAGDWPESCLDHARVDYGTCPINGAYGVRVGSVWGARGVRVESETESRLHSRNSSTRTSSLSDHSQDLRCSRQLSAERAARRESSQPLANA